MSNHVKTTKYILTNKNYLSITPIIKVVKVDKQTIKDSYCSLTHVHSKMNF